MDFVRIIRDYFLSIQVMLLSSVRQKAILRRVYPQQGVLPTYWQAINYGGDLYLPSRYSIELVRPCVLILNG